ncbi:Lipoprotein [Kosakonia sp. BK9b]|uniref:hypothetical protein n=1 Tax=Kosakonia sp. TaxID=1916651 RepID=UPI00289BE33A|nr:hypothetical protein [Kosakonia sp.]
MRSVLILLLAGLLAGCEVSSPQKAQYNAEYENRQDIHTQNVYRFKAQPLKSSGKKYWGAGNLAELFYVNADNTAVVELHFNYPAKSLDTVSRDAQNTLLRERTWHLLDESASKPADPEANYLYLTKDGRLLRQKRHCTPDMGVGCQWHNYELFITRHGDLMVQYASGGAGLAFLILPVYSSYQYVEIFPKVQTTTP